MNRTRNGKLARLPVPLREIAETRAAGGENQPPLSETLTEWVAASYTVATRRIAETDDPEAWHLLRQMCGDVVQLRRRDQIEKRLKLAHDRQQAAFHQSGRHAL